MFNLHADEFIFSYGIGMIIQININEALEIISLITLPLLSLFLPHNRFYNFFNLSGHIFSCTRRKLNIRNVLNLVSLKLNEKYL